jgi:4-carboxymuconolactone decarboxylase
VSETVRVAPISEHPADPIMQGIFDNIRARGGQILNIHRVLGNAPKLARAYNGLAFAIRFDATASRSDRELAIVRTAQIFRSAYELSQHVRLARACGLTPAQIDEIATWRDSKSFNTQQRALLAYVEEVANGGNVSDATFDQLARFYGPQEIVELTVTIGAYASTAMVTRALKIEIEDDGRQSILGDC